MKRRSSPFQVGDRVQYIGINHDGLVNGNWYNISKIIKKPTTFFYVLERDGFTSAVFMDSIVKYEVTDEDLDEILNL